MLDKKLERLHKSLHTGGLKKSKCLNVLVHQTLRGRGMSSRDLDVISNLLFALNGHGGRIHKNSYSSTSKLKRCILECTSRDDYIRDIMEDLKENKIDTTLFEKYVIEPIKIGVFREEPTTLNYVMKGI